MKYLFAAVFAVLVAASVGTWFASPEAEAGTPVIYWVTDANPARQEQVRLFHQWLIDEGHVTEDGEPVVRLRLDTGNSDATKKLIQGVSGVGGDLIDVRGDWLPLFARTGIADPVDLDAERLGFTPSETFDAVCSEITFNGEQYLFPCNVTSFLYWAHLGTFDKHGQPPPPKRWTIEEFERRGKAFVAAANPAGQRQTVFWCDLVDLRELHRSFGVSRLNETMTAARLDQPGFIEAMRLIRKWTHKDHLLPTASEQASFDTRAGAGTATVQLFAQGNYAMFRGGRWYITALRRFGDLPLAVVEPPHATYPNVTVSTRAAGVYAASEHRELAALFPAFLASEPYNLQVVRSGDSMPPNPKYVAREEYLRPPDHPNEWAVHGDFVTAADDIGIGGAYSPFVLPSVVDRIVEEAFDKHMEGLLDAGAAARQAEARINAQIEREVADDPSQQPAYEAALARQAEIDRRRAAGEIVPADWIANPFYRRLYVERGWAVEEKS